MLWDGKGGCELLRIAGCRNACSWTLSDMLVASLALGKLLKPMFFSPPFFYTEVVIPAHPHTFQKNILKLCLFVNCSGDSIYQTLSVYSKIYLKIRPRRLSGLDTKQEHLHCSQYEYVQTVLNSKRFDSQLTRLLSQCSSSLTPKEVFLSPLPFSLQRKPDCLSLVINPCPVFHLSTTICFTTSQASLFWTTETYITQPFFTGHVF